LSNQALSRIVSSNPLHVLVLTSGKADVYLVKRSGAKLITAPSGTPTPQDVSRLALQLNDVPWAILVDQSEETFWGGAMPPLKGIARDTWINRMADQSGTDSPYRWFEVQGKSKSHEGQVRVLGYTLGRPEALTPWLDALMSANARIRGVYAPAMLLPLAMKTLKLKPNTSEDDISVLVTPHVDGLRQTVMVGGKVRFSRLALHPESDSEQWFHIIQSETTKLRDYLIGNGLLKNDRAGMQIDCILPQHTRGLMPPTFASQHPKDRYRWLPEIAPYWIYVVALASGQPWRQLAPHIYRKRDLSVQAARALYAVCGALLLGGLFYVGIYANQLWQKRTDTQAAIADTTSAVQRYQTIAKTFSATPLTAAQLIDMSKRWDTIDQQNPPTMQNALLAAGQTLERHPSMILEEIVWAADAEQMEVSGANLTGISSTASAMPSISSPGGIGGASSVSNTNKKEVTALLLRGTIRGIASDDLRGTRDALAKLEQDFNRQPKIRAEITKRPLDLSTKASLSGSGTQDKSELSFEVKLWQR
jgi:hypothetical protein